MRVVVFWNDGEDGCLAWYKAIFEGSHLLNLIFKDKGCTPIYGMKNARSGNSLNISEMKCIEKRLILC